MDGAVHGTVQCMAWYGIVRRRSAHRDICSTAATSTLTLTLLTGTGAAWQRAGVTVLAVPGSLEYTTKHGVYAVGPDAEVQQLLDEA